MLVWGYPRTAAVTEELYNLCMRRFDSMPNMVRALARAGKLPAWAARTAQEFPSPLEKTSN